MPPQQSNKVKAKATLAKIHERNISAFFRTQGAMVLRAISRRSLSAARSFESPSLWSISPEEWDLIWQNITNQTTPDLSKIIAAAEADGLHAGSEQLRKAIGLFNEKSTFNLANPRAVAWFQENGGSVEYIKGIQKTTGGQIRSIVTNALNTGQAYTVTAKEIQGAFDGMTRDRAQRIAVFETGQAYEAGNRLFAESLVDDGVKMQERWVTSHDEKVRPEHAANEAEGWVELGHVYSSGDTDCPTDPGCRCYKEYRQAPEGD